MEVEEAILPAEGRERIQALLEWEGELGATVNAQLALIAHGSVGGRVCHRAGRGRAGGDRTANGGMGAAA